MLPLPPSSSRTSVAPPLRPPAGNTPSLQIILSFCCKLSKDSLHMELKTRLIAASCNTGIMAGFALYGASDPILILFPLKWHMSDL